MITSVFSYKLSKLTVKRDAAMAAGATAAALRLTDEILDLIAAEKKLRAA
ncbi:hypothetical protein OIU34_24545 [Pararhizobium sp. BT-229]|nr:hypothetical protein [Pararhizobium sp. BT-229]MCV9965071.1 hypothetical protein [Pararhizobium sp. BT-229]